KIRLRSTWHRHGIKCLARADRITESNGAACPGKNIPFSVLAQLRHPPPKLDRAARTCALGRTRDYSHGIRIFRTQFQYALGIETGVFIIVLIYERVCFRYPPANLPSAKCAQAEIATSTEKKN